jgi:hypothetical protein
MNEPNDRAPGPAAEPLVWMVFTPNDFADLREVEERLRRYEEFCNRRPQPFAWEFTTDKLHQFLQTLAEKTASQRDTQL